MAKDRYKQIIPLLAQNKIRVTSTVGKGHNIGSKHYIGDAVDIDNITAIKAFGSFKKLQAALPTGWIAVDETTRPAGQKVWTAPHYHLEYRGTGGAIPQQNQLSPINLTQGQTQVLSPAQNFTVKTPGEPNSIADILSQIDKGESAQFFKPETGQAITGGVQANIITPVNAEVQQPQIESTDIASEFNAIFNDSREQFQKQQQEAAVVTQPEQNWFEQGMDYVGGLANQAGNAIQTEASYRFSPEGALDLLNTAQNAVAQISPIGVPIAGRIGVPIAKMKADANPSMTAQALTGGVMQLGANVANFGSGITGQGFNRFQVPNSLQQAMTKLPVTASIGENFLQAAPLGNVFRFGKPLINLAADTLLQAGIGLVGTPGDLGQRGVNAVLASGLNLGTAGLGKVASKFLKPATQLDNVARVPANELRTQLGLNDTQQFNTLQSITPDQPTVMQPLASELPQPKQAFESAQVFKGGVDDISTAKQLVDDAVKVRTDLENTLYNTYQVTDPIEAQRALGRDILEAKNTYNQYGEAQALDNLNQKQSLYDNLMTARAQEVEAAKLLNDLDPQSLYRGVKPLPEVNLANATELAPLPTSAVTPNSVVNQLAPNQMQPIVRPNMAQAVPNTGPNVNQMQPLQPSALGVVDNAKPEIFNQKVLGSDAEKVIQDLTNGDPKTNSLVSLQNAFELIEKKQAAGMLTPEQAAKQKDFIRLSVEAGRGEMGLNIQKRELKEGLGNISKQLGKAEIKTREDLAPVAITQLKIKKATDISNVVKQYSPDEAYTSLRALEKNAPEALPQILNHYRGVASRHGITPTTTGKTVAQEIRNLVKQLYDDPKANLEFTHNYITGHNFKSGGGAGVRHTRLDTIEQMGISQSKVQVPENNIYPSQFREQYAGLQRLASAPEVPENIKKALNNVINKPGYTTKDLKAFRKAFNNMDEVRRFCQIFGLE